MSEFIKPVKTINWEKINAAKARGRVIVEEKAQEDREAAERLNRLKERQSRDRFENFLTLMRTEIGDLIEEFDVSVYGDSDDIVAVNETPYYLSAYGLCNRSHTVFYLTLPEHNPIHVSVSYGSNHTGGWVDSDEPSFSGSLTKFMVYLDPTYKRKLAGRIKQIKRTETALTRKALEQVKGYGFDDIGEALICAEDLYRLATDPNSDTNKLIGQYEGDDEPTEQEIVAGQVIPSPYGIQFDSLSQRLESMFTLSRRNSLAREGLIPDSLTPPEKSDDTAE